MKKIKPSKFYPKPQMQNKNFDIYFNYDDRQRKIDEHHHNYYEFFFLISGKVVYTIDDIQYDMKKGDVLFIKPNQRHFASVSVQDGKPAVRYVLWLSESYLKNLCSDLTDLMLPFEKINNISSHMYISDDMQLVIADLLQQILRNIHSEEYGADLMINSCIIELLVYLARLKLYGPALQVEKNYIEDKLVSDALEYISVHITEKINIEAIARYLNVSKSTLSRKFSLFMDTPIHDFITKKKLFLSKAELLQKKSVKEVYITYGFGSYSSFFRAFKKEFGVSPTELVQENARRTGVNNG